MIAMSCLTWWEMGSWLNARRKAGIVRVDNWPFDAPWDGEFEVRSKEGRAIRLRKSRGLLVINGRAVTPGQVVTADGAQIEVVR
jgi:hypothetical protein